MGDQIMDNLVVVGLLFVVSTVGSALLQKWSTRKVLGIDISIFKSSILVLGRSLAALFIGFAIGYLIRILRADLDPDWIRLVGMGVVTVLSFLIYWILLGKLTKRQVSLVGMTKTVALEGVLLVCAVVAIALLLSLLMTVTGAQP